MTSTQAFVAELRMAELATVLGDMPSGGRLLEVGAGAGWQARELEKLGFVVEAVDVPDGNYTAERVWPVRDYDGIHLPFEPASFDVVFSSNVLEHVVGLPELLKEMWRVLRPGGCMVHVVPSASWRFWTSITYYPYLTLKAAHRLRHAIRRRQNGGDANATIPVTGRRSLAGMIFASPHGTAHSAAAELLEFRRSSWFRRLADLPAEAILHRSTRLFYSGYSVLGRLVSIRSRTLLSTMLGSSCHIFVLRKPLAP